VNMRIRIGKGSVRIVRDTQVFEYRPLRSRTVYRLPLECVAEMVMSRCAKADSGNAADLAPRRGGSVVRRGLLP